MDKVKNQVLRVQSEKVKLNELRRKTC